MTSILLVIEKGLGNPFFAKSLLLAKAAPARLPFDESR